MKVAMWAVCALTCRAVNHNGRVPKQAHQSLAANTRTAQPGPGRICPQWARSPAPHHRLQPPLLRTCTAVPGLKAVLVQPFCSHAVPLLHTVLPCCPLHSPVMHAGVPRLVHTLVPRTPPLACRLLQKTQRELLGSRTAPRQTPPAADPAPSIRTFFEVASMTSFAVEGARTPLPTCIMQWAPLLAFPAS